MNKKEEIKSKNWTMKIVKDNIGKSIYLGINILVLLIFWIKRDSGIDMFMKKGLDSSFARELYLGIAISYIIVILIATSIEIINNGKNNDY